MTDDVPGLDAKSLINQIFDLWVLPHVRANQLDLERADVWRAVVVMKPGAAIEVLLNEAAELGAKAKVRDAVAFGEPVTADNVEHTGQVFPLNIDPSAGWILFTVMPGDGVMVAFDFRRDKPRAHDLLTHAGDYLSTAREALTAGRLGPVVENTLAAAEFAVTAMTALQAEEPRRRASHSWRSDWLNRYTYSGNALHSHYKALRRLTKLRPYARYGEAQATPSVDELAALIEEVDDLIKHAAVRARDVGDGDGDGDPR